METFKQYLERNLSPSEALYGFAAWLTTRDEPITIGAKHDASEVAELVVKYCKTNKLKEPRDHRERDLTHPKEK